MVPVQICLNVGAQSHDHGRSSHRLAVWDLDYQQNPTGGAVTKPDRVQVSSESLYGMWRQSKLLDLKLWQTARQAAEQAWRGGQRGIVTRQRHESAGKANVRRLEEELAQLKATSLEQLQEQVKNKVCTAVSFARHEGGCSRWVAARLDSTSNGRACCRQKWKLTLAQSPK